MATSYQNVYVTEYIELLVVCCFVEMVFFVHIKVETFVTECPERKIRLSFLESCVSRALGRSTTDLKIDWI